MSDLRNLLPEELSDESAYQLVTFFENLTSMLESHYFAQMQRYQKCSELPKELPAYLQKLSDNDSPV